MWVGELHTYISGLVLISLIPLEWLPVHVGCDCEQVWKAMVDVFDKLCDLFVTMCNGMLKSDRKQ